MPVKAERALRRGAEKKGLTGERKNAYIWGGLRDTGWRPYGESGWRGNPEGKKGGKRGR